jgi:DNA-binding GntR family transcriptional regulator
MLGVPYGTVRTALTRLKHSGEVVSPGRGFWTVAPVGAELEVVK